MWPCHLRAELEGDITAESVTAFVSSNSLPLVNWSALNWREKWQTRIEKLSSHVWGGRVQQRHSEGDLPGELQQPSPHVPFQGGPFHYKTTAIIWQMIINWFSSFIFFRTPNLSMFFTMPGRWKKTLTNEAWLEISSCSRRWGRTTRATWCSSWSRRTRRSTRGWSTSSGSRRRSASEKLFSPQISLINYSFLIKDNREFRSKHRRHLMIII